MYEPAQPTIRDETSGVRRSGGASTAFALPLVVIVVLGLGVRVLYVGLTRDRGIPADGLHYHFRAAAVAAGHGFVNPLLQLFSGASKPPPDAANPPGWTVALAAATKVGLKSLQAQKLFAGVIGAGTIAMTALAGRAAFGRRAGLIAAGIIALYPNVWLYERELDV